MFDFHDPVSFVTHFIWALLCIPSAYFLLRQPRPLSVKITLIIFIVSALSCYTASSLYHSVSYPYVKLWMTLDYSCIFLLVAGTYTPVMWNFFVGTLRIKMVVLIWLLALVGIVHCIIFGKISEYIYLVMAWGILLVFFDLGKLLVQRSMWLIMVGGLLYTCGAALDFIRQPVIIEGVISHHEVFHVFVMAGTTCHYWFFLGNLRKYD